MEQEKNSQMPISEMIEILMLFTSIAYNALLV